MIADFIKIYFGLIVTVIVYIQCDVAWIGQKREVSLVMWYRMRCLRDRLTEINLWHVLSAGFRIITLRVIGVHYSKII
jgi:hypothetical protein